ncbi:hypothetical protein BU17DRAFT_65210 [Hysterangium stoloniferum]|nr:hypothetical protein BU17DRAFT_65210 [Hysterangium stoloniferum]
MSNTSSEEEDAELLSSNPWRDCKHVIEPEYFRWILMSPQFPCIPQLDSLEYRVIKRFESNDSTEVMKVHTTVNGIEKLAILKLYRDLTDGGTERDTMLDGFILEFVAYSNITHFGLCDEGLVPHCYGWYDFASELQDGAAILEKRHPYMSFIWEDKVPPRALLIEYLEDTAHLSPENYTPQIASDVLDTLQRIHSIGIIHRDPVMRNVLVHSDGKMFLIDFEHAYTLPPEVMHTRWTIYQRRRELSIFWEMLYYFMARGQQRLLQHRNKSLIENNKS